VWEEVRAGARRESRGRAKGSWWTLKGRRGKRRNREADVSIRAVTVLQGTRRRGRWTAGDERKGGIGPHTWVQNIGENEEESEIQLKNLDWWVSRDAPKLKIALCWMCCLAILPQGGHICSWGYLLQRISSSASLGYISQGKTPSASADSDSFIPLSSTSIYRPIGSCQRLSMAPVSSPPSLRWSQHPLLKHLHAFLTSPRLFWPFVSLMFLGELVLGLLIIRFVPCTSPSYISDLQFS
jgi:hypothetical protein